MEVPRTSLGRVFAAASCRSLMHRIFALGMDRGNGRPAKTGVLRMP